MRAVVFPGVGRMEIQDVPEPEARPGWRGQWEWRISPTGKAIPVRPPGDMAWRKLG